MKLTLTIETQDAEKLAKVLSILGNEKPAQISIHELKPATVATTTPAEPPAPVAPKPDVTEERVDAPVVVEEPVRPAAIDRATVKALATDLIAKDKATEVKAALTAVGAPSLGKVPEDKLEELYNALKAV